MPTNEILKNDQNFVRVLGGITNDSDQDIEMLRVDPITKRLLVSASFTGVAVTSLNGLTGAITLAGGTGITVTPAGQTITISLTSGGEVTSITGTANQVIASASTGAITLSTPQDIATSSTPTFSKVFIGDGAVGTPALAFSSSPSTGIFNGGTVTVSIASAGTQIASFDGTNIQFYPNSTGTVKVLNGSTLQLSGGALNGGPAAASPVATTINGAAGSGTNIAGGNLTLASGIGTGTGTESATIFKGPVRVASGTGAQTSQELMRLSYDNSATFAKLNLGVNNSFQTQLILNGASGTQTLALGTNGVTATINSGSTPLRLTTSDTTNGVSIGSSPLTWVTDNTFDIGASGATRPRTLYIGTSTIAPAGTAGAPAYTFDAGTGGIGMYRIGNGLGLATGSNGNVGFAVSGGAVSFLQFTGSNTSNTAVFNVTTGSARSGSSAAQVFASLTPSYNQTSTAGATDLLIARTETALGSGAQYLINALAGSAGTTQMFSVTNTGKLTTALGIGLDGNAAPATGIFMSGQLNWNNQIYMDGVATGILRIQNDSGSTGVAIDVHTADTFKFRNYAHNADAAVTMSTIGQSGLTTKYNNVNTAGWGVPAIYGSGRSTAQVGAVASVATYTVGAADGSFMVSANANITAFVAGTFNVTVAYTDETNTAQTLKLNFASVTGTLGIALAAAGPYEGIPNHIRCKAATAITIATSGTFTSLTYNVEGVITQIT